MKLSRFWLLALLSVPALVATSTLAIAEEDTAHVTGKVELGASFTDTKDNPARVNEYAKYRSDDGLSAAPKLNLEYLNKGFWFEVGADINGPRDQKFDLSLDASRVFRLNLDYQAMEHWKDHETLDQMGATGRDDTGGGQPSVTTDKTFADLIAAGQTPSVAGGTINYDPLQAYQQELDNNYIVTRREWEGKAEVVVPELPNVVFHAGVRVETREGMEQAIGITKCDNCHISAVGKTIDERTEDVKLGATGKFGLLTVAYEYLTRKFTASGASPERYYEPANNGTAYNLLYPEWQGSGSAAIGGDFPFARTPESDKDSHTLKARVDLSNNTSIVGSYVKADIESTKDNTQSEYQLLDGNTLNSELESFSGKISTRLGDWRLAAKASTYEIDVDGNRIYFPAREASASAIAAWPGETTDEWESAEAREVKEFGFDAVYRLAKGTTLRLGYEYEEVERDEDELGETETNTFKVALKSRVNKSFSGSASYKYQDIDQPMSGALVGIAQGDPAAIQDVTGDPNLWYYLTGDFNNNTASVPTWYWTSVYPNRQLESTSLPDTVHEAKLSGTWSANPNLAATLFTRYRYEENDDVEYKQTTLVPGASIYYAPSSKINLTMAYTFNQQDTENRACVGWYHG